MVENSDYTNLPTTDEYVSLSTVAQTNGPEFSYLKDIFANYNDDKIIEALMHSNFNIDNAVDYLLTVQAVDELDEAVQTMEVADPPEFIEQQRQFQQKVLPMPTKGSQQKQKIKSVKPMKSQRNKRVYYINSSLKFNESNISSNLLKGLKDQFGVDPDRPTVSWLKISDDAQRLAGLTNIPLNQAKSVLHINKGDFFKSILFIICKIAETFDIEIANSNEVSISLDSKANKLPQSGKINLGEGRRVQGQSFNALTLAKSNDSLLDDDSQVFSDTSFVEKPNEAKVQDKKSTKAALKDLQEIMDLNTGLYLLSDTFYNKAMDYFHQDVDAVILLASVFIAENKADLTRNIETLNQQRFYFDVDKTAHNQENERSSMKSLPISNVEGYRLASKRKAPSMPKRTYQGSTTIVDYHGYTVSEALSELNPLLEEWWDAELEQREHVGTINPNAKQALLVGNVKVITGRGVHSASGHSLLRSKVRNYLKRQNYLFDEDVGFFVIYGKQSA